MNVELILATSGVVVALALLVHWLLQGRCAACGRRSLRGRLDRRTMGLIKQGVKVNPAWLWSECARCRARFKTAHYGDGILQPVDDDEWNEAVATPTGSRGGTRQGSDVG